MAQLLVSVRSASEAVAALEGGAALIDIKEPSHGALGRADDAVIAEIVRTVARRRPVSAALGEWNDETRTLPDADLAYVKWGLAGCGQSSRWRDHFDSVLSGVPARPQVVLVAYADWQCAQAPSIDEIAGLACRHPGSVLLVDTHCKDANNPLRKNRPTLLDWLPAAWIEDLCAACRVARVEIALAGSLGLAEIRTLLPARPSWFAVRGAACADGDRQAGVQVDKVRQLVTLLRSNAPGV